MNYKLIRRISFITYGLFAVLFCIFLAYRGNKEIKQLQAYSEAEKRYALKLTQAEQLINTLQFRIIRQLSDNDDTENAGFLKESILQLNRTLHELTSLQKEKSPEEKKGLTEFKEEISAFTSAALTFAGSVLSTDLDRRIILRESVPQMNRALNNLKKITDSAVRNELLLRQRRQTEITYFSEKLIKVFLIFFILTTSFAVTTSFILNRILRHGMIRLSLGAREISSGNYQYRFREIANDEIGSVMNDFNFMAAQLKKNSDELKMLNDELLKTSRHKDRFLANMSHELRTPLNSVVGFSELLIDRAERLSAEKVKSYGVRILNAAEHLLSLISDLLDIAKVDAGVVTVEKVELNLTECLNSVAEIMEPVIHKRGIRFIREIPDNLSITADRKLLKQIFINLLNNAAKFTHEGEIKFSVKEEEDSYRVSVSDTGIGISKEDRKRIFEDFQRVETGMTSNYEGVGIGLTLTQRLVELHNGRITLQSKLNEGSIFTVILPKKES